MTNRLLNPFYLLTLSALLSFVSCNSSNTNSAGSGPTDNSSNQEVAVADAVSGVNGVGTSLTVDTAKFQNVTLTKKAIKTLSQSLFDDLEKQRYAIKKNIYQSSSLREEVLELRDMAQELSLLRESGAKATCLQYFEAANQTELNNSLSSLNGAVSQYGCGYTCSGSTFAYTCDNTTGQLNYQMTQDCGGTTYTIANYYHQVSFDFSNLTGTSSSTLGGILTFSATSRGSISGGGLSNITFSCSSSLRVDVDTPANTAYGCGLNGFSFSCTVNGQSYTCDQLIGSATNNTCE